MSDQVWWYATRAAGLMTWSTAMGSVIVGLLLSTRAIKSRTGPWMLDLHRFLGGLSVLFLVVHVVTLYLDSFVDFGPRELFIPGESTWNPEAAAWGIIAMYALILVELTSLLRRHISPSVWRTFHMLSIVTAVAGTYHAFLGGTDVDNPLTWLVAGAGSAIVIALVALRLKGADAPGTPRVAKSDDREALLQEMRDRLENLPIPAEVPLAELSTDGSALPRRSSPVPGEDQPDADAVDAEATTPPEDPFAPAANPFVAPIGETPSPPPEPVADPFRPTPDPTAGFGDISDTGQPVADPFGQAMAGTADDEPVPTLPNDPFAPAAVEGFGTESADPFAAPAASPFLDPADLDTPAPPADPFAAPAPLAPSPFDAAPSSAAVEDPFAAAPPTPEIDAVAEPLPEAPMADPAPPTDLPVDPFTEPVADATPAPVPFTPAPPPPQDPDPFAAPAADPFAAAPAPTPTPVPATSPADPFAEPAPAAAAAPTTTAPPPPPLPDAVDPVTGEPDQAAYSAWLVEWLAYAEKYGEEAPEDPSRVL